MSQRSKVIHDFQALNLGQLTSQVTQAGTNITLTSSESGDIIELNSTNGSVVTLPSPLAGLIYRFIISNTGAHVLTAPSACINGAVANAIFNTGANLATGAAKTSISTTTGSVIGDTITLIGNGNKYFLTGTVTNYNAVKFD